MVLKGLVTLSNLLDGVVCFITGNELFWSNHRIQERYGKSLNRCVSHSRVIIAVRSITRFPYHIQPRPKKSQTQNEIVAILIVYRNLSPSDFLVLAPELLN